MRHTEILYAPPSMPVCHKTYPSHRRPCCFCSGTALRASLRARPRSIPILPPSLLFIPLNNLRTDHPELLLPYPLHIFRLHPQTEELIYLNPPPHAPTYSRYTGPQPAVDQTIIPVSLPSCTKSRQGPITSRKIVGLGSGFFCIISVSAFT